MIHGRFIYSTIATFLLSTPSVFAANAPAVPGEYVIKMKSRAAISGEKLSSAGVDFLRVISVKENISMVRMNRLITQEYALDQLRKLTQVEIAEPNYIYKIVRTPNDPQLGELWGLMNDGKLNGRAGVDIGAEAAWDIETGSDQVVVAVIDTGIDYTHPDLQGNVWTNAREANGQAGVDDDGNGYVDDIYGYDFVNSDGDPMDDHGHGTHCSGTIGARGNDGNGIVGVAWNVKLMGLKFLAGDGSGTLEDAIKAIDYATAAGVDIMSNSWGGGGYSELLKQSIEGAEKAGILFVAAAGNSAEDNDVAPAYPATYDVANVVSVAAIDRAGRLANFSSYGATTVHLAAPGVAVYSSIPGGHASWNGTSMATPHVSGVAALLKSQESSLTYAQIKERMMLTSRPLAGLRNKVSTMGVVNAYYALTNQAAPADELDPYNWASDSQKYSTAHPYSSKANETFTVRIPAAKKISVYFEKFQTENQYDVVTFKDGNGNVIGEWSGTHDGEYSPVASGDTLYIELKSDSSVEKYGFDITKVAYQ
jgi:thermitase